MNKIISIGQAAKLLGVHVQTLRNWEKSGKLKPDSISPGGTRRYNLEHILQLSGKEIPVQSDNRYTVAYARVSSHDQKDDLKRQHVRPRRLKNFEFHLVRKRHIGKVRKI